MKRKRLRLFVIGIFMGISVGVMLCFHFISSIPKLRDARVNVKQSVEVGESTRPLNAASPSALSVSPQHHQLLALLDKVRIEGLKLNSPMGLYAKIIDQYGQPVAGVPIDVKYRYYSNIVRTSWESNETITKTISDNLGEFGFTGASGVYLRLEPIMPVGIKLNPPAIDQIFERGSDGEQVAIIYTKQAPYVFHAWRMGKPGALRTGEIDELQEPNGDIYSINLSSNKLTLGGGGGIEIQIKREMNMPPGYKGPWSVKMHGVKIQFKQVTDQEDPFRFMAPVNGYDSEFAVSFGDPKNSGYLPHATYHFWIFDGKYYGVMDVDFTPFHKNTSVVFVSYRQSIIEGDRNLQPVK